MAAFRRGHVKVVKYLVKKVTQFPNDTDGARFISAISDKVGFFGGDGCQGLEGGPENSLLSNGVSILDSHRSCRPFSLICESRCQRKTNRQ